MTRSQKASILWVLLSVLIMGACGGNEPTAVSEGRNNRGTVSETEPNTVSVVAQATVPSVAVFETPRNPGPKTMLSNPNEDGAPRVFLVKTRQEGWLEVLLPVRPNGSRGWIRESEVLLVKNSYRIKIELDAHRITVWNGPTVVIQEPIGVGRANTPTPRGEYYITSLIRPPRPDGVYGPFAFGLSGYSNVYQSFAGGNGAVGLHGTNDPSGLGKDVSAGCIRMSNEGITRLASMLPLGTPVEIVT